MPRRPPRTSRPRANEVRWLPLGLLLVACGDAAQPTAPAPGPPQLVATAADASDESGALDASAFDELTGPLAQAAAPLLERIRSEPRALGAQRDLAMLLEANHAYDAARDAWRAFTRLAPGEPRGWYGLARMQIETGDSDAALEALDRVVELAPDYPPVHWRRGLVLLDLDRLDEAERAFARTSELVPNDVSGPAGLARVALRRGETDAALARLEQLLENHPRDGYVHSLLARAAAQAGDRERAELHAAQRDQATSAWKLDPWAAEVRGRAIGFDAVIVEARRHISGGRPAEALRVLEPMVARFPGNFSAQSLFVGACVAAESFDRARAVLDASEASAGPHFRTDMNRAVVEYAAGHPEEALAMLDRAEQRNPTYPHIHRLRGRILMDLSELEGAEEALARAIHDGDGALETRLELSETQRRLGKLHDSASTLRTAAASFPGKKRLWVVLVAAELESDNVEGARDALERLRRLDPEHRELAALTERVEVASR